MYHIQFISFANATHWERNDLSKSKSHIIVFSNKPTYQAIYRSYGQTAAAREYVGLSDETNIQKKQKH